MIINLFLQLKQIQAFVGELLTGVKYKKWEFEYYLPLLIWYHLAISITNIVFKQLIDSYSNFIHVNRIKEAFRKGAGVNLPFYIFRLIKERKRQVKERRPGRERGSLLSNSTTMSQAPLIY
jgi:hypothetical protein